MIPSFFGYLSRNRYKADYMENNIDRSDLIVPALEELLKGLRGASWLVQEHINLESGIDFYRYLTALAVRFTNQCVNQKEYPPPKVIDEPADLVSGFVNQKLIIENALRRYEGRSAKLTTFIYRVFYFWFVDTCLRQPVIDAPDPPPDYGTGNPSPDDVTCDEDLIIRRDLLSNGLERLKEEDELGHDLICKIELEEKKYMDILCLEGFDPVTVLSRYGKCTLTEANSADILLEDISTGKTLSVEEAKERAVNYLKKRHSRALERLRKICAGLEKN